MEIFYCICHGSNTQEFLGVKENLLHAASNWKKKGSNMVSKIENENT